MNLWKYTQNELPSEKEFFEIGQSLISNLSMHLSIEFKIFKESVEPKSWFHADIRGKCHKRLVHLIYDGILVYCFKQGEPVVDVVFLVFSNGSRVRLVSGETILTLHYTKNLEWTTLGRLKFVKPIDSFLAEFLDIHPITYVAIASTVTIFLGSFRSFSSHILGSCNLP